MQKNPTTNDYVTLQQNSRAVYMQSKMAVLSKNTSGIYVFNLENGRGMNESYFVFKQQSYKKANKSGTCRDSAFKRGLF